VVCVPFLFSPPLFQFLRLSFPKNPFYLPLFAWPYGRFEQFLPSSRAKSLPFFGYAWMYCLLPPLKTCNPRCFRPWDSTPFGRFSCIIPELVLCHPAGSVFLRTSWKTPPSSFEDTFILFFLLRVNYLPYKGKLQILPFQITPCRLLSCERPSPPRQSLFLTLSFFFF